MFGSLRRLCDGDHTVQLIHERQRNTSKKIVTKRDLPLSWRVEIPMDWCAGVVVWAKPTEWQRTPNAQRPSHAKRERDEERHDTPPVGQTSGRLRLEC